MLLQQFGPYLAVIFFGVVGTCAHMSSNEMVGTIQFPGTLWCGPGNSAQHYDDLGFLRFEDMCCRSHDQCPYSIESLETKWRLTNFSPFVASHCDCDNALIRCLKNVNTDAAYMIYHAFRRFSAHCFYLDTIDCSDSYIFKSNRSSRLGETVVFAPKFLRSNLTTGTTYPNGTAINTSMEAALVRIEASGPPTESLTPPTSSFRAREVTNTYNPDTHLIPLAPQECCMNTFTESFIEPTNNAPNYVGFTPINQPLPLTPINYPFIFKPIPLRRIPFIPRYENNYLTET